MNKGEEKNNEFGEDKNNPFNSNLYSNFIPKNNGSFFKKIKLFLTIFLGIIFLSGLFLGINSVLNESSNNRNGLSDKKASKVEKKKVRGGKMNLLLVGVDSNGMDTDPFEGTRSDAIILATIDFNKDKVNFISIPRDSKVFLADNNGVSKINTAHAVGGIKLLKDTIEETFGIKINNFVAINSDGIKTLVDAIGGIPIYVEKPMHYNDYAGKLHINLTTGTHVLNGEEAVGYLRFRHDMLGDISRTGRQQRFLQAVTNKLKSPEIITKVPELLSIANKYVKTDLSLLQMSKLVTFATKVDLKKSETAIMPGEPNKRGYISYWIIDPEKSEELINRMVFSKTKKKETDFRNKTGIVYERNSEETAKLLKEKLEQGGYEINCFSRAIIQLPQIISHDMGITPNDIKRIQSDADGMLDYYQTILDYNKNYCYDSDFTITVKDIMPQEQDAQ